MIPVNCSLSGSGWGFGPGGALCAWSMRRLRLGMRAALQAQCELCTTMVRHTRSSLPAQSATTSPALS